jgi:Xaa-Pro aminopeptidase
MQRRRFAGLAATWLGTLGLRPRDPRSERAVAPAQDCGLPEPIARLTPMIDGVTPIGDDERLARQERARRLMRQHGIAALVIEPGTSLKYFTKVGWGLSERPFAAVLPARGEIAWICPAFEEARARELIHFGTDIRVWQEDESPYRLLAGILRDRGVAAGRIGIEEQLRFFILDGLRRELPGARLVSATPVTAGCRMFKSAAELALMQRASDITIAGMKAGLATAREGMTQKEMSHNMTAAFSRLGGTDPWALVGFGAASAFPHGTQQPQHLADGDIMLMDCGCEVEGYQSDITRTTVFGQPSQRQTEVWSVERRAQDAAFRAAQVGATCSSVDAAARKVITDAGFGPDYRVPGLPHRTGHGIGMDGHEWTNFVRGNTALIEPGMCFSDEPTIAIYGEFGIRLEDCLYITETGPRFFTTQSEAIDRPFA